LHAVSGCSQMQAIFGGARAAFSHSQKAVQSVAESALPLWSRQSTQLTSAYSASGSAVGAACLLAKRHCHSGTFNIALNTHQVRHLVQTVLTSNTAGQGRGFAAQAIIRSVPRLQHVIKRKQSTLAATLPGAHSAVAHQQQRLSGALAQTAGLSNSARKQVGWWLAGCSGWVFSMVVLGGMTRLTRSGLSMTDWKFTGERPPQSLAEWQVEFEKYKQSPEYRKVNRRMSLDEFKFIYWMEYAHRMWGRALGFVFAVPAVYFGVRGYINMALAKSLGLFFLMGGTQGLVGWWMVKSGLQEPKSEWDTPRVSPYRLAAHLTSAFVIYSGLLWTTLNMFFPTSAAAVAPSSAVAGTAALRKVAHPLAALIAITAISGVFVAGMDAGHAYNDFPYMNGRWVPDEYWAVQGWRGFFENTAAVQLHHRLLASTTLISVLTTWAVFRGKVLPHASRQLLNGLAAVTALQVTLGITNSDDLMLPASLGSCTSGRCTHRFSLWSWR
ncbi:MAG: cytochrome c oxidase assembly COX15-like, partial [Trebouxia sp. A1-2]